MKKIYQKPAMLVMRLQHQSHLLTISNKVQTLTGGDIIYGGSDESYTDGAR